MARNFLFPSLLPFLVLSLCCSLRSHFTSFNSEIKIWNTVTIKRKNCKNYMFHRMIILSTYRWIDQGFVAQFGQYCCVPNFTNHGSWFNSANKFYYTTAESLAVKNEWNCTNKCNKLQIISIYVSFQSFDYKTANSCFYQRTWKNSINKFYYITGAILVRKNDWNSTNAFDKMLIIRLSRDYKIAN